MCLVGSSVHHLHLFISIQQVLPLLHSTGPRSSNFLRQQSPFLEKKHLHSLPLFYQEVAAFSSVPGNWSQIKVEGNQSVPAERRNCCQPSLKSSWLAAFSLTLSVAKLLQLLHVTTMRKLMALKLVVIWMILRFALPAGGCCYETMLLPRTSKQGKEKTLRIGSF